MHIIFRGFNALISFRVGYSLGSMGGITFKKTPINIQRNKTNQLKNPNQTKKAQNPNKQKTPNNNKKAHTSTTPIFLQNLRPDEDRGKIFAWWEEKNQMHKNSLTLKREKRCLEIAWPSKIWKIPTMDTAKTAL